ncbi:MAG: hypothetical protein GWN57_10190 [Nitrospinaceae bacterium]|nr:hypothetical protein [Nitrospinaceae bacterium]
MKTNVDEIFGRKNHAGNIELFHASGERVTRLDSDLYPAIYPVQSSLSAHYEHPGGIIITQNDANRLNITMDVY